MIGARLQTFASFFGVAMSTTLVSATTAASQMPPKKRRREDEEEVGGNETDDDSKVEPGNDEEDDDDGDTQIEDDEQVATQVPQPGDADGDNDMDVDPISAEDERMLIEAVQRAEHVGVVVHDMYDARGQVVKPGSALYQHQANINYMPAQPRKFQRTAIAIDNFDPYAMIHIGAPFVPTKQPDSLRNSVSLPPPPGFKVGEPVVLHMDVKCPLKDGKFESVGISTLSKKLNAKVVFPDDSTAPPVLMAATNVLIDTLSGKYRVKFVEDALKATLKTWATMGQAVSEEKMATLRRAEYEKFIVPLVDRKVKQEVIKDAMGNPVPDPDNPGKSLKRDVEPTEYWPYKSSFNIQTDIYDDKGKIIRKACLIFTKDPVTGERKEIPIEQAAIAIPGHMLHVAVELGFVYYFGGTKIGYTTNLVTIEIKEELVSTTVNPDTEYGW